MKSVIVGLCVLAVCLANYHPQRINEPVVLQAARVYNENLTFIDTNIASMYYKIKNANVRALNISFVADSQCNEGLMDTAYVKVNFCQNPDQCCVSLHDAADQYSLNPSGDQRTGWFILDKYVGKQGDLVQLELCFAELYDFTFIVNVKVTEIWDDSTPESDSNWLWWLLLLLFVIIIVVAVWWWCRRKKAAEDANQDQYANIQDNNKK